jgi:anti-sigma B factor antagonist
MQIQSERHNEVLVVTPRGDRLDAAAAPDFKRAVKALIDAGDSRMVLDLSEVGFIDSSGLGVIVSILKAVGEDGALVLCGMNQRVLTLFRLTRFDRIFSMFATLADALAGFPSRG